MSHTPSSTQLAALLHTGVASHPGHEHGSPGMHALMLWQGTHCARPKQSGQVHGSDAPHVPSRCPPSQVPSSSAQCGLVAQSAQPQPS
jgi:hypothetical protein